MRYFTGHKGKVCSLLFSNCGRYLFSCGEDKKILFWDVAHGYLVAELSGHQDTIFTMCLSRDGVMLASGGSDNCIILWDVSRLIDELEVEDINMSQTPAVRTDVEKILLKSFKTKSTAVISLHFTRRNLLLAAGVFH